jgi:transcriptional regulator with XRE-family HTH domain
MADLFGVLCRRLVERREATGLTQGEVAARVGFSQQYISDFERGLKEPGVLRLVTALATLYDTSLDYLLGITDDPQPPPQDASPAAVSKALRLLDGLTPHAQANALEILAVFSEQERRRDKRVEEYERLIHLLQERMAPEEYAELMPLLLRAAWSNDSTAFSDIIARHGATDRFANKQP